MGPKFSGLAYGKLAQLGVVEEERGHKTLLLVVEFSFSLKN